MRGWLCCKNLTCILPSNAEGNVEKVGDCLLYTNLLNKFYNDTIKNTAGFFLEGYISNKQELLEKQHEVSWEDVYKKICLEKKFPTQLRGSFSGFSFSENGEKVFFTDHLGSKSLFYYFNKDKFVVSSRLEWIVEILIENGVNYHFDELAAQYMLTYGFMLDDSTFIKEIKRILPGNKVVYGQDKLDIIQYYMPTLAHQIDISEDEAISMIDGAFRKAIKREFEKDREYGYKHLVDLSGGLDSRMVTWVAHEMGYVNQTNFTYCKSQYIDFKISSQIASDLKHEYYFKQLDDFQWIYEIEDILKLNNGQALYSGITGGKDCLANFNKDEYGIEHTGMLGDVIISCFASDESKAFKTPQFGTNQYSSLLNYAFADKLLNKYENQEIFDVYSRGFLGAMSTYSIRQSYFEVGSPFLDIDFMETCFSIPIKYRVKHNIYLKWMKKYYVKATNYGWEKWAGIPPKRKLLLVRDGVFCLRKFKRTIRNIFGFQIKDNMNPIDFWYANDVNVQFYFEQYYTDNINNQCISNNLRQDITRLFQEGTAIEKTQVLTVLGMVKMYFSGEMNWKRI